MPRLRLDHGAQRQLLQVHELRQHQRLQLIVEVVDHVERALLPAAFDLDVAGPHPCVFCIVPKRHFTRELG